MEGKKTGRARRVMEGGMCTHLHAYASLGIPEPGCEVVRARQDDVTLGMPVHPLYAAAWALQHVLALPCGSIPDPHLSCQQSKNIRTHSYASRYNNRRIPDSRMGEQSL